MKLPPLSPSERKQLHRDLHELEAKAQKECRDCGSPFLVPIEQVRNGSKWYSLCGSCIRWER